MFTDDKNHTGFALDQIDLQKRMILKNHGYTDGYQNGGLTNNGLVKNRLSITLLRNVIDTFLMLEPENKTLNFYLTDEKFICITNKGESIKAFIAPVIEDNTATKDDVP